LVQIVVILSVARAAGWLFGKFRQPQVIGEMVAGILLGPCPLEWFYPAQQPKLATALEDAPE
jgi:Kef-type K+ transport system membrane component KefB